VKLLAWCKTYDNGWLGGGGSGMTGKGAEGGHRVYRHKLNQHVTGMDVGRPSWKRKHNCSNEMGSGSS
jgi:hypothetical protein